MKLIVDECLSHSTVHLLQKQGFTILEVESILEWGIEDEAIFSYAAQHQIALITHDRRFGQIFHQALNQVPTTIVLQVCSPHPDATNQLLKQTLSQIDLKNEKYSGKLIIITSDKIRIRSKLSKK